MAERKKAAPNTTRKPTQKKWVRNLHAQAPAYLRLDNGRRFELRPRGQRGDSAPVTKDDLEDMRFKLNLGLLFELITEGEAENNIVKQTTNQKVKHPALDRLRNEHDQPYEKGVVVDVSHEAQGVVVASVTADSKDVNITRAVVPGTTDYAAANPDFEPTADQKADEVARNKGLEGPAAGLGGEIKVTTEPIQKN